MLAPNKEANAMKSYATVQAANKYHFVVFPFLSKSDTLSHITKMEIEFDDTKDESNIAKHGMSLNDAVLLLENDHVVRRDGRREYGEDRMRAYGLIANRLHVCVYTVRGNVYRVISLRKANRRERNAYR